MEFLHILVAATALTLFSVAESEAPNFTAGSNFFTGRATYYGVPPMPGNAKVHCDLPNNMFGLKTIALNKPQYGDSKACGTCVRIYGKGNRCHNGHYTGNNECGLGRDPVAGVFDAVVTDELVERGVGDIDIGEPGDGEWPVSWHTIPCPEASPKIMLHGGANPHFAKIQMRYIDSPMESMELNGQRSHKRWHDNYFEFTAGGAGFNFINDKIHVKVWSRLGTMYCGDIDRSMRTESFEYSAWRC